MGRYRNPVEDLDSDEVRHTCGFVGFVCVLDTGKAAFVVQSCHGTYYEVEYKSSGTLNSYHEDRISLHPNYTSHNRRVFKKLKMKEDEGMDMRSTKLYMITSTGEYCTKLAVNSKGEIVVELKGTGRVQSVAPGDLEKVVPHTVRVQLHGESKDFQTEKGALAVGDLVVIAGRSIDAMEVGQVIAVDTASERAGPLKGYKLSATAIGDFAVIEEEEA